MRGRGTEPGPAGLRAVSHYLAGRSAVLLTSDEVDRVVPGKVRPKIAR